MELTDGQLHELFVYDDTAGELRARISGGRWCIGKAIGQAGRHGYRITRYRGRVYLIHRLIWRFFNGPIPQSQVIDHIDGDRLNNRIANLRCVTRAINQRNAKRPSHNRSGHVGVCWDKNKEKWMAYITLNNRFKFIGAFNLKSDAVRARKAVEVEHGFHPNHGRVIQ